MTAKCLVFSYFLDGKGGGESIEEPDLAGWTAEQGVLWSHIEYGQPGALDWLLAQGVTHVVAEALTETETRPRMVTFDSGTLITLRGVNMNPGAAVEDMISIRLWLDGQRIITARQRRLLSIDDIREGLASGHGPKNTGEFLIMLVERIAERIGQVVDRLEDGIDQCESEIASADTTKLRSRLSDGRRKTAAIRRFLAPQRDALDAVYRVSNDLLIDNDAHYLREQADRITRYVEDLDLVRERAVVVQEELLNRIAQEQNSRMYLLSIVATIFLPLSFLTGVFGMNVAGLPGTENTRAFIILTLGMLAIGLGIVAFMRSKRWF